ncbi:MAG: hypothetical protein ABJE47_02360 [bacterium]
MIFLPRRSSGTTLRIALSLGLGAITLHAPVMSAQAPSPSHDSLTLKQAIAHLEVSKFVETWVGRSGKLLAHFVAPSHAIAVPVLSRLFGDESGKWTPRVERMASRDSSQGRTFAVIGMQSFNDKSDAGYVGGYRMGFWPAEQGRVRNANYENPEGFIEVTPENKDLYVSEHFRLSDFLTHDQSDVWPKYVVLREELLDKLELVIDDLKEHGVKADRVHVLSGFRTPQYNQDLGEASGRAEDSRHQFGDAADIYIDANNDGKMDDLNHDGRVDMKDSRVILAAVARVEAEYPELVGGTGVYHAMGSHGPFAHIDVRGSLARWVRGGVVKRPKHRKHTVRKTKAPTTRKHTLAAKARKPTPRVPG